MPKECPMCGAELRRSVRQASDHVPGMSEAHTRTVREWTCPECDYYEESMDEEAEG